ncbi:hypothetical protein NA56DRAFT_81552 [Hyaloscypha hepaticicola]|uniref:RING-type domain-containing protein n=1 Tax=Hyaloscypha hepaticicola TaxID=2082293 RepID=A0A2J6Q9N8_9HELO|nr:hypothetical protein NA56DRAFT_81552 [Hyaloscypha hepaticicola]
MSCQSYWILCGHITREIIREGSTQQPFAEEAAICEFCKSGYTQPLSQSQRMQQRTDFVQMTVSFFSSTLEEERALRAIPADRVSLTQFKRMLDILRHLDQAPEYLPSIEPELSSRMWSLGYALARSAPRFLLEMDLPTLWYQAQYTLDIVAEHSRQYRLDRLSGINTERPVLPLETSLLSQIRYLKGYLQDNWENISQKDRLNILEFSTYFLAWREEMEKYELQGQTSSRERLDAVSSLPKVSLENLDDDDRNCAICKDEFGVVFQDKKSEHPVRTPCGHVIGSECLTIWLSNHNTCPSCRAILDFSQDGEEAMSGELQHLDNYDESDYF